MSAYFSVINLLISQEVENVLSLPPKEHPFPVSLGEGLPCLSKGPSENTVPLVLWNVAAGHTMQHIRAAAHPGMNIAMVSQAFSVYSVFCLRQEKETVSLFILSI